MVAVQDEFVVSAEARAPFAIVVELLSARSVPLATPFRHGPEIAYEISSAPPPTPSTLITIMSFARENRPPAVGEEIANGL
jgi:hypothetical protein